jgi:hypothetical protein
MLVARMDAIKMIQIYIIAIQTIVIMIYHISRNRLINLQRHLHQVNFLNFNFQKMILLR